ncbi:hypothetical protein GCM10010274_15290 [Streptomyces lavendofoliae]|uniref:DUF7144 domain-containing protein n=2 Tax=Streptomyces lavendofoliae TaxID=67314 RepID=A0A918HWF4_9ACTN|nr:hypothetical protein GCM10010274_15290 [Streptomyces lavendofoliae]
MSEGPQGSAHHAYAHHAAPGESRGRGGWATGGVMFAGVLMMVEGVLGMLQGIAGIAEDDVYGRVGQYVFAFDVSAWGWIHLVLGLLVAVIGAGILSGAEWAKAIGVALAALAVIANFIWLPYQPVWAIVSIAVAVFVIWALCTEDTGPVAPGKR